MNSTLGAVTAPYPAYRPGIPLIGLLILCAVALGVMFGDAGQRMWQFWSTREEYSHGFLIPVIAAFLVYQRSDVLRHLGLPGAWSGLILLAFGLFVALVGELASIYSVVQYGGLLTFAGAVFSITGWPAFRTLAVPLFILFFMVPLPQFFYNNLSSQLQLISSALGVVVIRLFDIPVFLEGNVIDLGTYKLQVVEACSGLRYLFPLMTLGFIMAYFYQAAFWKRAVIFFSTIPITVLMNSFRIGVIGVTVEYFGQGAAEGFLHDFEGWVVFMACFGVLFIEMWLLMRITGDRRPLNHVFGVTLPEPLPEGTVVSKWKVPAPGIAAALLLILGAGIATTIPDREENIPARADFASYPLKLDGWAGRPEAMEQQYIDALKFTDYFMADYRNDTWGGAPVNWYIAYYESQRKGQSAHSPRSCIPGGGWRIESLTQRQIDSVSVNGEPLRVNRAKVSYGDNHLLVYYWFQQRGRVITNEYLVKWWMFWDALTKNRTDGALVRVTAPFRSGQDVEEVDAKLEAFLEEAVPTLEPYVPN